MTTELDAVNEMLRSIGERPISNLADTNRLDVANALATLTRERTALLNIGWFFNTEDEVEIGVDTEGRYPIPSNVLRIDLHDTSTEEKLVKRGDFLYDLRTRTTTDHTETLKFDQVIELGFDDMVESARAYVAARAGVTFQTDGVGSTILFEFTERRALFAYGILQAEQLDHEDLSILNSTTSTPLSRALRRR